MHNIYQSRKRVFELVTFIVAMTMTAYNCRSIFVSRSYNVLLRRFYRLDICGDVYKEAVKRRLELLCYLQNFQRRFGTAQFKRLTRFHFCYLLKDCAPRNNELEERLDYDMKLIRQQLLSKWTVGFPCRFHVAFILHLAVELYSGKTSHVSHYTSKDRAQLRAVQSDRTIVVRITSSDCKRFETKRVFDDDLYRL